MGFTCRNYASLGSCGGSRAGLGLAKMAAMKKVIILACLLFPSIAFAQYYSSPPPNSQLPGGFHNRTGRVIFGGSIGLGRMEDSGGDIECNSCDYGTFAGQGALHLGG